MIVLIRGGGDLATGVALRLYKAGLKVVMTELEQPTAVRRLVSFSEAVYQGQFVVEGVTARKGGDPTDILKTMNIWSKGHIPVLVDPDATSISVLHPQVVVDARLMKQAIELPADRISLLIGLGPGFKPGINCHAVVETARGPTMGRLYWNKEPFADTGIPEQVMDKTIERVLRAPEDGCFKAHSTIGDILDAGVLIGEVAGVPIRARFRGVVRGLLPDKILVVKNQKVGDLDPRCDVDLCSLVSDKALAIAGGVLEAILSRPDFRKNFWS